MNMFFTAGRLVAQAQNGRELSPSSRDPSKLISLSITTNTRPNSLCHSALPLPQLSYGGPSGPAVTMSPAPALPSSPSLLYASLLPLQNAFQSTPAAAAASSNSRRASFNQTSTILVPIAKSPIPNYQPISADERQKYAVIFQSQRPIGGLITEEQAKSVFVKSQLPAPVIDRIW